jgi:hypothetical protein
MIIPFPSHLWLETVVHLPEKAQRFIGGPRLTGRDEQCPGGIDSRFNLADGRGISVIHKEELRPPWSDAEDVTADLREKAEATHGE